MTISGSLGYLSLAGYLALLGQAFWKTRDMSKDRWGLCNHGFDKIPKVIDYALRHCLNRGFMVITDRKSYHCVVLRKYILRNGERGLELGFPDADWSASHAAALRAALKSEGVSLREASERYREVKASIHVDCGRDINKAVELVRRCFFELFGLPPTAGSNQAHRTIPAYMPTPSTPTTRTPPAVNSGRRGGPNRWRRGFRTPAW